MSDFSFSVPFVSTEMEVSLTADERATLDAAFAFIDANYEPRTVETPRPPPLRSYYRNRMELVRLRELVQSLESQRDALVAQCNAVHGRWWSRQNAADWKRISNDVVQAEAQRLERARALNTRLRHALEQQRDVGTALVHVLQRRLNQKCVQELLDESTLKQIQSSAIHRQDFKAFSTHVQLIVAAAKHDAIRHDSHTNIVRHPTLGPVVKAVASVKIAWDLYDVWTSLTSHHCAPRSTIREGEYHYNVKGQSPYDASVSETTFSIEIVNVLGHGPAQIDGLVLVETIESIDWKVLVWSSMVALRGETTYVRERGWIAMTGRSGLHSGYELYAEKVPRPKATVIVDALLQKARYDREKVETTLIQRFGLNPTAITAIMV